MACILGTAPSGCGFESGSPFPSRAQLLEPYTPCSSIHLDHDPLMSLLRPLFLLTICSGQAPLLLLPFSSGTVLLQPSLWVPPGFEAGGVWTISFPPPLYTQCHQLWRNTLPRQAEARPLEVSPFSRGLRILELLTPHFQHHLETPWTWLRASPIL